MRETLLHPRRMISLSRGPLNADLGCLNETNVPNLLRSALLCLVASSAIPMAMADDTYRNPTAGFEITKPPEWQFVTAAQVQENLERTKLNDPEFHAAMLKYATVPMVAMMKYPEPYDDVNPSFKVNIKPLGQFKGKSTVDIVNFVLPQFERVFKDYVLVQTPLDVEVSGLKGTYFRITYSLETADGQSFPTSSELWIIPRGDYFFMIGAGTRQDEKTGSRSQIQDILRSVRIEH